MPSVCTRCFFYEQIRFICSVRFLTAYIAIIFMLQVPVCAQTVEWSNQQKIKSKTNFTQVLGSNSSGIFLLRSRTNNFSRELIIEKYKFNLTQEDMKDFWQPAGTHIEKVFLSETGLTVFASQRVNGKLEMIYWSVDNNLVPTPQPTMLFQMDASYIRQQPLFYIFQNQTKTQYTIASITPGGDKNSSIYTLASFSNQNTFKYLKQFSIDYAADDVELAEIVCDNAFNIFALVSVPDAAAKKSHNARNHFLYAFYDEEKQLSEYSIDTAAYRMNETGMAINEASRTLIISGFYTDKGAQRLSGSFMQTYDIDIRKITAQKFEPFDMGFLSKTGPGFFSGSGDDQADLYVRKVIARSDGGCVLIAEKYYETRQAFTYYVQGMPQVSYRVVYNYEDIVVLSKKTDGTTETREVFKKKQTAMNEAVYYSSFFILNTNDRLAFIYNQDATTESDVMMSTLSPKGETDTRILIKSLSFYVALMPLESKQINANTALFSTIKDRRFSLMRLTF
jgi:hypothetical protein